MTLFLGQLYDDDDQMSRRPSRILLPCSLAVLLAALSIASQRQQPAPSKSAGLDTSCLYDFERGVIRDCLQKVRNGELSVKQQVLKQLQFDSHGLAVVRSMTNGWNGWNSWNGLERLERLERLDVCFPHRKGRHKRCADNGQLGGHFLQRLGSSREKREIRLLKSQRATGNFAGLRRRDEL
jgi:hypothetical protein